MDTIDPRKTHIVIDGENLTREQLGGPCPMHPSHFVNGLAVAVILIAIGAALWAADVAQGVPA